MEKEYRVSTLGKTWIFDLDGTLVKHNGYKIDGRDSWLDGALEFLQGLSSDDHIIFLTSRTEEYREMTENFLKQSHIKYDVVIYGLPYGERILVNDTKPSGLLTAIAVNTKRDCFMQAGFIVDEKL